MEHRTEPEWPDGLREIDHTGDIGIAVSAPTPEVLFTRAAWGLFAMLTDLAVVRPLDEQEVVVEGADRDDLMVRWLSELNFRHVARGWVFSTFDIQVLSEERLVATVRGEKVDLERHVVYTEIKAVTYHGLYIRREDEAWHAQVIFDM